MTMYSLAGAELPEVCRGEKRLEILQGLLVKGFVYHPTQLGSYPEGE